MPSGFGKSMNFTAFALAKEEIYLLIENLCDRNFASKLKYYRRPDFGNVVAELYFKEAYDGNNKFASRKSTSIFSIGRC